MTTAANRRPVRQLDLDTLLPYLDLHLVGATNGVRLFQAATVSWAGSPYADDLARLQQEIGEERDVLERLIEALGHRPSPVKMSFARVLAVIAGVNPLNPLRRKTSAGAQLELEALQSLLKGKESLWSTLLALPPDVTGEPARAALPRPALEQLLEASRRQQDTVAHVMTGTASARFLR